MKRDLTMLIRIPKENETDFRLFTVLHGGEIVNASSSDEAKNMLGKIRPEIYRKQYDFMSDGDYNEGIRFGLMLAYQIINKYMAESEEI